MMSFELQPEEVILYEGAVTCNAYKGNPVMTLTSMKIVFEKEKGLFKKERELVDIIQFSEIKFYNGAVQIKQKGSSVEIQTVEKNLTIQFSGMLEAGKFTGKAVDAITGTNIAKRSSDKIKDAFSMVDDTLGFDTRGAIKGVLEQGIKGTVLNGFGRKK